MAKSLIIGGGSSNSSAGATVYCALGSTLSFTGTEANRTSVFREAGTASKLFVRISNNTLTGSAGTITLRKNATGTSLSVSITAGVTGVFEDTSNSVTVASGDEYTIQSNLTASGGTQITVTLIGVEFLPDATGDTASYLTTMAASGASSANATNHFHIAQTSVFTTAARANAESKLSSSYTATHLSVYVSANARTSDTNFRLTINGSNGNQVVTYTSGQTGRKVDSTNTDSLVSGDNICYSRITGTGTGTITFQTINMRMVNTSNRWTFPTSSATTVPTNTTTYRIIAGTSGNQTTESFVQYTSRFDFTAANLRSYVATNTFTTLSSTITVRKNAADTSLVLTFAAGQTGWKEDTSNTADFTAGTDAINYKIVTPNEAGNLLVYGQTLEGYTASTEEFIPRIIFMG